MAAMIEVSVAGAIGRITLNRPEARNAVNGAMARQLSEAVTALEDDPAVHLSVLAATGPAFCAGQDLKALAAGEPEAFVDGHGWAGFTARDRRKPVIAAVDGPAAAGGFELVLACDLVVASRRATFSLPEVRHGLLAAAGGAARLPHVLPPNVALELLMTGAAIDAERAHTLGLVNRLAQPGGALEAAEDLAREIDRHPLAAVLAARRVALASMVHGRAAADGLATTLLAELLPSSDVADGLAAFTARRKPRQAARIDTPLECT
jgi:enoyl-CoA hydratase